jgi:uncharacterized membrane protein
MGRDMRTGAGSPISLLILLALVASVIVEYVAYNWENVALLEPLLFLAYLYATDE